MVYIDKYCPHCRARYERSVEGAKQLGSPLRICPKCKKGLVDKSYTEPFFEAPPTRITLGKSFLTFLFPWGILPIIAVAAYDALDFLSWRFLLVIGPLIFYLFLVFATYLLGDRDYKRKKEAYSASFQRLQNPDYVAVLLDGGCYVAPEFLESTHPQLLHRNSQQKAPTSKSVRYWY